MDAPKPAFMEEYLHQAALSGEAGHDEKFNFAEPGLWPSTHSKILEKR